MKRIFIAMGVIGATLSFSSCQNEKISAESINSDFSIMAIPEDVKTSNDGLATKWVKGDQMNVFHAAAGTNTYVDDKNFKITDAANGTADGTLAGSLDGTKEYDWYVLYPYVSGLTTPANSSKYSTVGCKSNATQSQNGNNSMAHLAGANMPLYGQAKAVKGNQTPAIAMHQAAAVVEINITNCTEEDLTVSKIFFTAPESIVGTYYINFAGDTPTYTPSGNSYVNSSTSLTVSNGTPIQKNGSAKFYIAVKPFTAAAGSDLKFNVNGYEKVLTLTKATSFTAGKIKTVNFNYDKKKVAYSPNLTNAEISTSFSLCSESGYGDMTIESASGKWTGNMFRGSSLTYIQLRGQTPSRLISPEYAETIKSIKIKTCNNSVKDRTFYVLPGNEVPSAYSEDGLGGNIGSYKTTVANEEFTIDFQDAVKQFEIVVLGGAVYIESITVTLGAVEKKLVFNVDTTPIDVTAETTSASFTITADSEVAWTVTPANGLTFSPESGSGNATVNISFAANTSKTDNVERTITVSTSNANVIQPTQTIEFIQRKVVAANAKYVKVTADSQITTGKYLIVWGNEAHATISGSDLAKTADVKIVGSEIANNASLDDAAVIITKVDGGHTVQLPNGKYLSCNASSNKSSEVEGAFTFDSISVANGISGKDSSKNQRYLCKNGTYYRFYTKKDSYVIPTLYIYTE